MFIRRHNIAAHSLHLSVKVIHMTLYPGCSVGSWIQSLLSRLSGDEGRRSAVDVARQRRQCAQRNATVNTTVSHLHPGETADRLSVWIIDAPVSYFYLTNTLRASPLHTDEAVHPEQNTGDADGAAALWTGVCVRRCCSRCLLPFRGIRDQWQVWVL